MEINLKKLWPVLGVLLCSMTSLNADAYDNSDMNNGQKSYHTNPSANHNSEESYGGFIFADYILWAVRANLPVGYSGVTTADITVGAADKGAVFYPDFKLNSGFRVGAGAVFDHDQWDILLSYTWLRQNNKTFKNQYSVDANEDSTAYGLANQSASNLDPNFANQISSFWKYQLNDINLELGRNFFAGHYFAVRPHTGLKFAWTRNELATRYRLQNDADVQEFDYVTGTQKFFGVGIRAGLDPTYYFNDNWQLYAMSAFSLPWSKFQVTLQSTESSPTDENSTYAYYMNNNFYAIAPVGELELGLRWMIKFGGDNDDAYAFALQAGWAAQAWWDQVNYVPVKLYQAGDLTQQGFTLRARFDF